MSIRVSKIRFASGTAVLLLFHCLTCCGQPAALDLTFNPGTGGFAVASIFVESNAQIIVGGDFQKFNGQSFNSIVRLNADGSIDSNFFLGQGPDSSISTVAVQSNGMILVGGVFLTFNGISQSYLARLRVDGSLDITFIPSIVGNGVASILQQGDGNILMTGSFFQVNGQAMTGIARLTSSGSLDTSFQPDITSGSLNSMKLDASRNILIAGQVTIGTNQLYAARLMPNGSLDTTFSLGSIDGAVAQIGLEPNGEIIITGSFTEIDGYSRDGIAELYSDGAIDTNFRPNPATDYGTLLAIEADGKILTTGNGGLMRVNTDASVDTSFNPAISSVNCLVIQPDGRMLVGGAFNTVNGTNLNGIARLQGDSLTQFQTQLLNLQFYAGMQLVGSIGTNYRIESSTTLSNTSLWMPVTTFTLTTTPFWFLDTNPISPNESRFYRAIVVP